MLRIRPRAILRNVHRGQKIKELVPVGLVIGNFKILEMVRSQNNNCYTYKFKLETKNFFLKIIFNLILIVVIERKTTSNFVGSF